MGVTHELRRRVLNPSLVMIFSAICLFLSLLSHPCGCIHTRPGSLRHFRSTGTPPLQTQTSHLSSWPSNTSLLHPGVSSRASTLRSTSSWSCTPSTRTPFYPPTQRLHPSTPASFGLSSNELSHLMDPNAQAFSEMIRRYPTRPSLGLRLKVFASESHLAWGRIIALPPTMRLRLDGVCKMVCDKGVCVRWCVTKRCVTTGCVEDGVWQRGVCMMVCDKEVRVRWCATKTNRCV